MLMYKLMTQQNLFVRKSVKTAIVKAVRSKELLPLHCDRYSIINNFKKRSSTVSKKHLQILIPDNKEKEVKKLWKKARAFGSMENKRSWQVLREALKLYIRKKSKC